MNMLRYIRRLPYLVFRHVGAIERYTEKRSSGDNYVVIQSLGRIKCCCLLSNET